MSSEIYQSLKGDALKKFLLLMFFAIILLHATTLIGEEGDTYSISLVRHASIKMKDGKEIIYENYKVKKGDHIWNLLRQRDLLKKPDLYELLLLLKNMNKSLTNLDLIYPDQHIIIPLNIVPIKGNRDGKQTVQESIMGISSLKDITFEDYKVKPGDSLTMVVHGRYKIPGKYLYTEYLDLVRKFNPALKNANLIYPNQFIRLPIYSPELVRMPIETAAVTSGLESEKRQSPEIAGRAKSLEKSLQDIFNAIGENWVNIGEHFIPLKSGGQINLKADSYPVLNLRNGNRVIIDIKDELPEDITQLIISDWEDYNVVHLTETDTLNTAVDKILEASRYYKIIKSGQKFEINNEDVVISISADWIIFPHKDKLDVEDKIIVLTLIKNQVEQTPQIITTYLSKLGITVIDYPNFLNNKEIEQEISVLKKITIEKSADSTLPIHILNMSGQSFLAKSKIPIFQGEGSDFNITVQPDLFFHRNGKDCIIDTTGLPQPIISLLKKHQFLVLSIAGVKDVIRIAELILDFLESPYDSNPHQFLAAKRDEARNIKFTIDGITFFDHEGNQILAIDKKIPEEICLFLNKEGYTIFELNQFENKKNLVPNNTLRTN